MLACSVLSNPAASSEAVAALLVAERRELRKEAVVEVRCKQASSFLQHSCASGEVVCLPVTCTWSVWSVQRCCCSSKVLLMCPQDMISVVRGQHTLHRMAALLDPVLAAGADVQTADGGTCPAWPLMHSFFLVLLC